MLSYQHGYHAGSFADVIKHTTLLLLLNHLKLKEKPLVYIETHAGRGRYRLDDYQAQKTGEAKQGVVVFWQQAEQSIPQVFTPYRHALKTLNSEPLKPLRRKPSDRSASPEKQRVIPDVGGESAPCHTPSDEPIVERGLKQYPGSPWLAVHTLRQQDRLVLHELHPREFDYLTQLPRLKKRVLYQQADGMISLKSLLPPPERRGLIFIDPSYEVKNDYRQIPIHLKSAYARFPTGVYCVWYPLLDASSHHTLLDGLRRMKAPQTLRAEFYLSAEKNTGMRGCGLWIINPPYTLKESLQEALQYLCTVFNPGTSSFLVE